MKTIFKLVLAMSSLVSLGYCGGNNNEVDPIENSDEAEEPSASTTLYDEMGNFSFTGIISDANSKFTINHVTLSQSGKAKTGETLSLIVSGKMTLYESEQQTGDKHYSIELYAGQSGDANCLFDFGGTGPRVNLTLSNIRAPKICANLFYNSSALKSVTFGPGFDASVTTDLSEAFNGCSSLTTLDLSSFGNTNGINLSGCFAGCTGLTSITIKDDFYPNDGDGAKMFGSDSGKTVTLKSISTYTQGGTTYAAFNNNLGS